LVLYIYDYTKYLIYRMLTLFQPCFRKLHFQAFKTECKDRYSLNYCNFGTGNI